MILDWFFIACVFGVLLGLYALMQFAISQIARGIREFRETELWP